ncbi:DNA-processing protein DprA [Patescibacteria group bacterium]|nr:DNA-processing protein DprA [Patescibacteria group bacterium]MBU4162327.1 DNA-processing protein DprA [Patescibacteria group bacterium]
MEDINTIDINNPLYPQSLKEIIDPPRVLYYKGNLDFNSAHIIAVVGTRRCSDYGKQATIEIVSKLAQAGFAIISGMAKGIDTIAHQTALDYNSKTIAVLGTGIDDKSIYPQENLGLSKKIIENNGAIISEYPPNTPGHKSNFPERNRIISGISQAVLVIEAKEKSGALITVRHAFQQKKIVFALPGSIYAPNSKGCNRIIKNGAKLIEKAEDIFKEFGISPKIIRQRITNISPEEKLILDILKNQALHINKIIELTKLSSTKINSLLINLEMTGIIRNLGNNTFIIKNKWQN